MKRQTRNLSATETTDFAGGNRKLNVKEDVQIVSSNEAPRFSEAEPQGINPKILLLRLEVPSSGIGTEVLSWKTVEFVKPVSSGQYSDVSIINDDAIETAPVQVILS